MVKSLATLTEFPLVKDGHRYRAITYTMLAQCCVGKNTLYLWSSWGTRWPNAYFASTSSTTSIHVTTTSQ